MTFVPHVPTTHSGVPMPGGPLPAGLGPMALTPNVPTGEAQRQQVAASIMRAYRWLEKALPLAPDAHHLIDDLLTTVSLYAARQYETCQTRLILITEMITSRRLARPDLPEY
jgi:hypothetical protein